MPLQAFKEDFKINLRLKNSQFDCIESKNYKFLQDFQSLVFSNNSTEFKQLDIYNIKRDMFLKFPSTNTIDYDDWFYIKQYKLVVLISKNTFYFYNVNDGSLVSEKKLLIDTKNKKLIYNNKLNKMILISEDIIKVFNFYFKNKNVDIKLYQTIEVNYSYGYYLKAYNYFFTYKNSTLQLINLEDGKISCSKDMSLQIPNEYTFLKKFNSAYLKEYNLLAILFNDKLVFFDCSTLEIRKILEGVSGRIKKVIFNGISYLITYDDNYVMRIWEVFNFTCMNAFKTSNKILSVEFSRENQEVLIIQNDYSVIGSKIKLI